MLTCVLCCIWLPVCDNAKYTAVVAYFMKRYICTHFVGNHGTTLAFVSAEQLGVERKQKWHFDMDVIWLLVIICCV